MRKLLLLIFLVKLADARAQLLTSSNLPIIVIKSRPGPTPIDSAWYEIIADMGVIDNGPGRRNNISDPYNNFSGPITIKVQGSSSVMWPKRSFRISTLTPAGGDAEVPLLGLPPHEDWIFKASYQDKTFIRDALAFHIFNEMGHYSSRVRFFELVIDGDYRGIYQLEEKVRRNDYRVNIAKMTINDNAGDAVTGGYIISLDKFVTTDPGWYSKYKSSFRNDSSNYFLYYYPKPDSITEPQKNYIKGYFDRFEDALASTDFTSSTIGYRRYIDVGTFIDNFLVNELAKNVDGYRASTFFTKDRESVGGKLKAMPIWDFNIAFGNCDYNTANYPSGWQYTMPTLWNFVPWWWGRFLQDPIYRDEMKCRYTALRKSALNESRLFQYIDQTAALLQEATQRNFARWPILGQVVWPQPAPAPADYAGEIGYLKYFLHERLAWLDQNITGTCIVNVKDTLSKKVLGYSYPNPFAGKLQVNWQNKEKGPVSIRLTDVNGATVLVFRDGDTPKGIFEDQATTGQLPPGTYILTIETADDIMRQKLIKLEP